MGEKEINYNDLSKGVKNFLQKRGIQSQYDLDLFVNPTIEKLALPGKDTLKIAESLYNSIRQGKKIFVWGDEDVDGITSTFLLYESLKKLNAKVEWHIPSRATEGYGLNKNGIDMIKERGGEVIVTVDCGITSFEEAEYSKSLGIELIITDHHEPRNTLPEAMIVNPKVNDVGYRYLAGVGVALKFFIGIVHIATGLNPVEVIKTMPDSIIFAMIGTITDRVPRLSENRILVVEGEKYLHKSKRPPFMVLA
ncbi:single-stranded-DNA-specific exonuclease RecJ, partial [bacterium]